MTLFTCVKIGTAIGFGAGLVSSGYFMGAAESADKNDNPATFAIGMLSGACFIGGPVLGSGAGLGYYGLNMGVKHLRAAPRSAQIVALTILGLGIATTGAYKLGKNGQ